MIKHKKDTDCTHGTMWTKCQDCIDKDVSTAIESLDQQLLEANAHIERLVDVCMDTMATHVEPASMEEVVALTRPQSLALHDAELLDKLLDVVPWWHDREFLKIDEVLSYADTLHQDKESS